MTEKYNLIIIGAGAGGVFAAINTAIRHPHLRILILEKNNVALSKVKISGGGRCNVTHSCFNPRELCEYYPRGNKSLIGPFHQFNPEDTINWFAERAIQLKTEDDGRMFPVSNNSQTIIDCFMEEIKNKNIQLQYKADVQKIQKQGPLFEIHYNDKIISSDKLLIATGGFKDEKSYNFIKELGHTIISPAPSLFTFNLPNSPLLNLQGLATETEVTIKNSKFSEKGPLLITHWGVSGPAILKLSSWAARELQNKNYNFDFQINWLPHFNLESIKTYLKEAKQKNGAKKILNTLNLNLPKKLRLFLANKAQFNEQLTWANLSKKQLQDFAQVLTQDNYTSQGKTTFKQEFVSCGGVNLKEIHFKTMESKIVPNLYFAGEILDIDAVTGGFNFQAAWTTGFIAAQNIF